MQGTSQPVGRFEALFRLEWRKVYEKKKKSLKSIFSCIWDERKSTADIDGIFLQADCKPSLGIEARAYLWNYTTALLSGQQGQPILIKQVIQVPIKINFHKISLWV